LAQFAHVALAPSRPAAFHNATVLNAITAVEATKVDSSVFFIRSGMKNCRMQQLDPLQLIAGLTSP
jgi:hypothetical protein